MTRSARRQFLKQSFAAMATITIAGTKSSGKVLGSDEAIRIGRTLHFDPTTERFIGDRAQDANAFLTREYRRPFIIPEHV